MGAIPENAPFRAFAACGSRLLVIGGNAMIAYGSQRLTQDCDCAVVATDEQMVEAALLPFGYVFLENFSTFSRYVHLGREGPVVDVMLLDRQTFDKLSADSREIGLMGARLRAPSPLHLVALKLHALKQEPARMGKDWEDIKFLLGTYREEWTREELDQLAQRYASAQFQALLRDHGFL